MLRHAIAHGGCTDTVKESALKSWLWEKNPLLHQGLEPVSVLCLAFQSDDLPTELSPPFISYPRPYNLHLRAENQAFPCDLIIFNTVMCLDLRWPSRLGWLDWALPVKSGTRLLIHPLRWAALRSRRVAVAGQHALCPRSPSTQSWTEAAREEDQRCGSPSLPAMDQATCV